MELKGYQQRVIDDLDSYLEHLGASATPSAAWKEYWGERDYIVGDGDGKVVPPYHDDNIGAAKVCVKVPTGGGKTFIGAAAVKAICDRRRQVGPRFVVWLVPSDAILGQTVRNFKNPEHEYRRRLNADFGGRVEVFTKEEMLNGQNFSPDAVNSNLCVAVFCYSSIRANPNSKEDRKVYQENGNLQKFESYFNSRDLLMADTPETALIQVIRRMRPIVIVDESHNVGSSLSIEMLRVLGADFVLSMTATPRNGGRTENVISCVGAAELKAEHMVKLPVMVYNKASTTIVVQNALDLRAALESAANRERSENGGRYIRPIVLFQAQPKNAESSETYEKIKAKLIDSGVPEDQVKIKTADKDELDGVDLMDENCKVRFIITVNALKEGWDCPFAYILASLANKSSTVDVEQVVGRVLRQPYATESKDTLLNMSYVLTSSDHFQETVKSIVQGLNESGFGEGDCKVRDGEVGGTAEASASSPSAQGMPNADVSPDADNDDLSADIGTISVPPADGGVRVGSAVGAMTEVAKTTGTEYANRMTNNISSPMGAVSHGYGMQELYAAGARALEIPQFVLADADDMYGSHELLEREDLLDGFSLSGKDACMNFTQAHVDAYSIDVSSGGSKVAQANASQSVLEYIAKRMNEVDEKGRLALVADLAYAQLNKLDNLGASEIKDYIRRILDGLPAQQRELAAGNVYAFTAEVRAKIRVLEDAHCKEMMKKWIEEGKVKCLPCYKLPDKIYPSTFDGSIDKSLYRLEPGDMNNDERMLASDFAGCDKVEWWHRIKERGEGEFKINGKCEGAFNHYPDFIVKMKSGKVLLVESKGDDRDNSDSKAKLELGKLWEQHAGENYRYFMVFANAELNGAMKRTDFLDLLGTL